VIGEAAEHGVAVDRFAREIVGILKVVGGALAATERQPVGPQQAMLYQLGKYAGIIVLPYIILLENYRYGSTNA